MNKVWDWITRNLSNIFGFLGIVVTIYVGVYYVPNWLKDIQDEKTKNTKENLIQSFKELVYADSTVVIGEIITLVDAKKIELKEKSTLSPKQLLLGAQESFMQDKYLPLEKRRELISEIEVLKSQISPQNGDLYESMNRKTGFLSWFSIVISLIVAVVGGISLYIKNRNEKAKQEEIDNQLEQANIDNDVNTYANEFENKIHKVLNNMPEVEILRNLNNNEEFRDFDIVFKFKGVKYYIQIKYLSKSKVGLGSLQRFLSKVQGREGNFWFIYNTGLTELVRKKVEILNKVSHGRKIEIIKVDSTKDFEDTVMVLLNKSF